MTEQWEYTNRWDLESDVELCSLHVAGECDSCRPRIGDRIDFLRFGHPVERSTNHRDRTEEAGMSCYQVRDGRACLVGWSFDFTGRVAYRGRGIVVGHGSDCEPLVVVETIRKVSRSHADRLVANHYEFDKVAAYSRNSAKK